DMQGRTLLVAEPKANELPFSVADWPAGTYLVTVRTARATASRKLVKQ
ncbi:MAG: T9SS type A sorting domain-containing protein, partial [Oscillospiraceae bacterium]|nr:T9SS type A sorting domain-containing protein [Oscillospiraceae bacterium]